MARKILTVISTVLLVLMIALVLFIFISRATGHTPSIFGNRIYRVQTNSMEPTLTPGDVILVHDVEPQDIHNGDIITYRVLSGQLAGQTITHRVVQEPEVRDGVYYYRTKGDREGAVLDDEISYRVVEGIFVKKLPLIDKLYSFFLSPGGLIVFIAVIVILFAYEIISLITSYKGADTKDDDYYAPPNRKPSKKRKKHKKTT